ncbi:MAG: VCBS repeat-containing protein [Acidobacteriota bacterium]|nr:VCBS repeat-containing protein [Acidobacteriota bacterium]
MRARLLFCFFSALLALPPSAAGRDRYVIWRDNTAGETRASRLTGAALSAPVEIPGYDGDWNLVGFADFDRDGIPDLLWRNKTHRAVVVTYLNQTGDIAALGTVDRPYNGDWKVLGVGDLDGDGSPDILWQNKNTFDVRLWTMCDHVQNWTGTLPAVPDPLWQFVGLGDFNGDGRNDLLWRHKETAALALWLMDRGRFVRAIRLPNPPADWLPVGVTDLDDDGDADLIWQAPATRQLAVWQMRQTEFARAWFIDTSRAEETADDPSFRFAAVR